MARGKHRMGELAVLDRYQLMGAPSIGQTTDIDAQPLSRGVVDRLGWPMEGYPSPYAVPPILDPSKYD